VVQYFERSLAKSMWITKPQWLWPTHCQLFDSSLGGKERYTPWQETKWQQIAWVLPRGARSKNGTTIGKSRKAGNIYISLNILIFFSYNSTDLPPPSHSICILCRDPNIVTSWLHPSVKSPVSRSHIARVLWFCAYGWGCERLGLAWLLYTVDRLVWRWIEVDVFLKCTRCVLGSSSQHQCLPTSYLSVSSVFNFRAKH
jgi:hypothetical protein